MPNPSTHSLFTFKDSTDLELRPDLDFVTVQAQGKPTWVTQGIFGGFSLPLYAANEELFFVLCVPDRWDGTNNLKGHIHCWLSGAEDTKNFKLQLSWEHFVVGSAVPATSTDVEVETATGATAPQFKAFEIDFPMTPGDLVVNDTLGMRLRRIAASANEIAGEVVVASVGVVFPRNILGAPI